MTASLMRSDPEYQDKIAPSTMRIIVVPGPFLAATPGSVIVPIPKVAVTRLKIEPFMDPAQNFLLRYLTGLVAMYPTL